MDILIFKIFQLADMLPSKTIPEDNRKSQGRTLKPKAKTSMTMTAPPKKKVKTVRVEEVEDEDSAQNLLNRNASVSSVTGDVSQKKKVIAAVVLAIHYSKHLQGIKKNPIHLFYEIVPTGNNGKLGDDGDIHYRCLHGAHKVCTIKKTMKSNLTGVSTSCFICVTYLLSVAFTVLVNNLKPITPMYNLYRILRDREEPPTSNEITMASGKKALDGRTEAEHLKLLEKSKENIKKAFEDQKARAVVSDQTCKFTFYLSLPNRDYGTKKTSSGSLSNGLLPATSPSVKLNNLSLSNYLTMRIMVLVH